MMNRILFFVLLAVLMCGGTMRLSAVDVSERVQVTTGNTRSSLDRQNGRVTSTVDVTLKNVGDRSLDGPLHAAVEFTAESGTLDGIQVTGATGGVGQPPHGTFFYDLSAQTGNALAPQATTTFTLRFTPARAARVSYRIVPFANVDLDPLVRAGGPYASRVGSEIIFDASTSTDPEGGALTFQWTFGDGAPPAAGAVARHTYGSPGTFEAKIVATDPRGHAATVTVPVTIRPAADFSVARVRALDGAGLPLAGVAIEERRDNVLKNRVTRGNGFAPLANGPGDYLWKFTKPGYRPVWRTARLAVGDVLLIPDPWLAQENSQVTALSPLNEAQIDSPTKSVRLHFNTGAFPQPAEAAITELSPQSLPFPLPIGWSPFAQFHLALNAIPAEAGAATLKLRGALAAGQQATLVSFDPATQTWVAGETVAGDGNTTATVPIARAGTFALVVPDPAPFTPPAVDAGQALTATTQNFSVQNVSAVGTVTPAVSAASRDAEKVTALARVTFTQAGPLPSGIFFPTRISETYQLQNAGDVVRTPDYDATIFAYARPGTDVAAEFPMRPQLLLGPDELKEAAIRALVLSQGAFTGAVIDGTGGVLSGGGVQVQVPPDAMTEVQPAELTPLDPQSFAGLAGGVLPAKAFSLSIGELAAGVSLGIGVDGLAPNHLFVLGLVVSDGRKGGITPVQRFITDGTGRLVSAEPATGPRLPGLQAPGEYVLIDVPAPLALVQGIARDAAGNAAGGLAIRTDGQPWLVFSASDGSYKTLATAGLALLRIVDPRDGNEGSASINITDPAQPQTIDVAAIQTGPRAIIVEPAVEPSVEPNPAAAKVRTVTPIVVRFTEPINRETFGENGVTLTKEGGGTVEGTLTLNVARTEATLLPKNPLEPGANYTITVSATIRDAQHVIIEGNRVFTFKTAAPASRGEGAQLVIYEPGADNVPAAVRAQLVGYSAAEGSTHVVAQGSAGTADPKTAVILVNQTTGTTATVVSNADGSFANFLDASEEDFVAAVFANGNGTRIEIPATRQLFDDGRVGLYQQGGILEAQSAGGRIQVFVKPQAIKERSVFKIEALNLSQILQAVNGTQPLDAKLLTGFSLKVEKEQPLGDVELSVPVDAASLNLPDGEQPENAVIAALLPVKTNGVVTYEMVDKLRFEDGRAVTNTFPFLGIFLGAFASAFAADTILLATLGAKPVTVHGRVVESENAAFTQLLDLDNIGLVGLAGIFSTNPVFGVVDIVAQAVNSTGEQLPLPPGTTPLAGALVSARPLSVEAGTEGRLDPGVVHCTSARDGKFTLVLPLSIREAGATSSKAPDYILRGIHPRYSRPAVNPLPNSKIGFLQFGTTPFHVQTLVFDNDALVRRSTDDGAIKLLLAVDPPNPAVNAETRFAALATKASAVDIRVIGVASLSGSAADEVTEADLEINPGSLETLSNGIIKRRIARLTARKPMQAVIEASATGTAGGAPPVTRALIVKFGAPPTPVLPDEPAPGNANDKTSPQLAALEPGPNSALPVGGRILVRFSEPVRQLSVFQNGAVIFDPPPSTPPVLRLSANQTTLEITLGPFAPNTQSVTMTLTSVIEDLNFNRLDKDLSTPDFETYTFRFHLSPVVTRSLSGVANGGGVTSNGAYAYVLDREGAGSVKTFLLDELLVGGAASPVATAPFEFPRDLALMPDWSFRRTLGAAVETKSLLAVVGGTLGQTAEGQTEGQLLRIYDLSNPASPTNFKGTFLTFRNAAVNRVMWNPPELAYIESGADFQHIGIVDVQEMFVGLFATPEVADAFPVDGARGADLNGNGSYTDNGEQLPIPPKRPPEFFGKKAGFTFTDPGIVQDLDFRGKQYTGVVMTGGVANVAGETIEALPSYRTLQFSGEVLGESAGQFNFGKGARPKRVIGILDQRVTDAGQSRTASIALVSLAPDVGGKNKIAIIDITNPTNPVVAGFENGPTVDDPGTFPEDRAIVLPESLGIPQGFNRLADGRIALSTSQNELLIDPSRLFELRVAGSGLHPAVVGVIPQAGSGNRTLVQGVDGVNIVSLGARSQLVQTAPRLRYVNFPLNATLVDPATLVDQPAAVKITFAKMAELRGLPVARFKTSQGVVNSSLNPAKPQDHYHVLVDAPGAAGRTIRISLESLNHAKHQLTPRGRNHPPIRAMFSSAQQLFEMPPRSDAAGLIDATADSLTAHRLSSDKGSPLYNVYLTGPFALINEKIRLSEIADLQNPIRRPILWGGDFLAASLDPSMVGNSVIGAFATQIFSPDELSRPAVVIASTQPGGDIPGLNPPPIGGEVSLPFTLGSVAALNGEVRLSSVDVELPSPRMPIVFKRVAGTQDTRYGPFGPDWDHNYNQRLFELKSGTFPAGSRKPIVERRQKIADSEDLEFVDGEGHVIVFRRLSDGSTLPGITNDPLIQILRVGDGTFYVAAPEEKGVFDVICKRPTGEFLRLTPEGTQFWYRDDGRLDYIVDRFIKNRHELEYNERGELTKIVDKSTTNPKFIRIGYYRRGSKLDEELDQVASSGFVSGRIAVLVDHVGRRTDFKYNIAGILTGVERPETDSGDFRGRPKESYVQQSDQGGRVRGIIAGNGAHDGANAQTPAARSNLQQNPEQELVATDSSVAGKDTQVAAPPAAGAGFSSTGPNGQKTETAFDGNGYPRKSKATGPNRGTVEVETVYNDRGLPEVVTHPNGSSATLFYDASPTTAFRSRGNVVRFERKGGPLGGGDFFSLRNYDPRYNQPTGTWTDVNQKTTTFTLRADGLAIERIVYTGGALATFAYNENGQPTSILSTDGVRKEYNGYNSDGYPGEIKRGSFSTTFTYGSGMAGQLGKPSTMTLPAGAPVSSITYDSRLLVREMTRGGRTETMAYDENGNMVLHERDVDTGVKFREKRHYDQVNFLEKIEILDVETDGGSQTLLTQFVPDDSRRVLSQILPGGETRTFTYDHAGAVRTATIGDSVIKYERDVEGNLTEVFQNDTSVQKLRNYDGHNRVGLMLFERSLLGAADRLELTYHPGGQLRSSKLINGSNGRVAEEQIIEDVDALGRPLRIRRTTTGGDVAYGINYTHASTGGVVTGITGPRESVSKTTNAAGQVVSFSDSVRTVTITPNGQDVVTEVKSREEQIDYVTTSRPNSLDFIEHIEDGEGSLMDFVLRLDGRPKKLTNDRGHTTTMTHSLLGERLSLIKPQPTNVAFKYGYDRNRNPTFVRDAANRGNVSSYDGTLRKTGTLLRADGASETVEEFTFHQLPKQLLSQLATVKLDYDRQGRVISREVEEGDGNFEVTGIQRDAKGRVLAASFGSEGEHSARFEFDPLGPVKFASYTMPGGPFDITAEIDNDGTRKKVTYPSNITVDETRQSSGRLSTVTANAQVRWNATSFQAAELPGDVEYGSNLKESNLYDKRKRLQSRIYTRVSDGAVVAGVRYKFDRADNRVVRQLMHGQGRADLFTYDEANRLTRAEYGARPSFAGDGTRSVPRVTGGENFKPGFFARDYGYDSQGLDLLGGGTLRNPDLFPAATFAARPAGPIVPAFAAIIGTRDDFLMAQDVDGFTRTGTRGNVTRAQLWVRKSGKPDPEMIGADLTYDGAHQLVKVVRDDDVTITYSYDLNGLMHLREVKEGPNVISKRALVWDEGRLIEEHELSGANPVLMGRYYYADGDWPVAADLRPDPSASPVPLFFLRDGSESVIAVANGSGNVIERVDYDAWGQPTLQTLDTAPPQVARVEANANGDLAVVFTEIVMPPIAAGTGRVPITQAADLSGKFVIVEGNNETAAQSTYGENVAQLPFGAVVIIPRAGLPASFGLKLKAGAVIDAWGNPNDEIVIPINLAGGPLLFPGTLGENATAPLRVARTTIGNPFLFHGQYFDYDAGLLYMRARFYEPFTGQFLQRDPMQYEDSVNLYAGFANSPTTHRDPSGEMVVASGSKVIALGEAISRNAFDVLVEGARMVANLEAKAAANANEVTGVVSRRGLLSSTNPGSAPLPQGFAPPDANTLTRVARRGEALINDLRGFSDRAQREGRLVIETGDLAGGQLGQFHVRADGVGVVTLSRKLNELGTLEERVAHSTTLFHELSHARNRLTLGTHLIPRLKTEQQLFYESIQSGVGKQLEEFAAHMDEVAVEMAVRRYFRAAGASDMLRDFTRFGPSRVIERMSELYGLPSYQAQRARNPWWFEPSDFSVIP